MFLFFFLNIILILDRKNKDITHNDIYIYTHVQTCMLYVQNIGVHFVRTMSGTREFLRAFQKSRLHFVARGLLLWHDLPPCEETQNLSNCSGSLLSTKAKKNIFLG